MIPRLRPWPKIAGQFLVLSRKFNWISLEQYNSEVKQVFLTGFKFPFTLATGENLNVFVNLVENLSNTPRFQLKLNLKIGEFDSRLLNDSMGIQAFRFFDELDSEIIDGVLRNLGRSTSDTEYAVFSFLADRQRKNPEFIKQEAVITTLKKYLSTADKKTWYFALSQLDVLKFGKQAWLNDGLFQLIKQDGDFVRFYQQLDHSQLCELRHVVRKAVYAKLESGKLSESDLQVFFEAWRSTPEFLSEYLAFLDRLKAWLKRSAIDILLVGAEKIEELDASVVDRVIAYIKEYSDWLYLSGIDRVLTIKGPIDELYSQALMNSDLSTWTRHEIALKYVKAGRSPELLSKRVRDQIYFWAFEGLGVTPNEPDHPFLSASLLLVGLDLERESREPALPNSPNLKAKWLESISLLNSPYRSELIANLPERFVDQPEIKSWLIDELSSLDFKVAEQAARALLPIAKKERQISPEWMTQIVAYLKRGDLLTVTSYLAAFPELEQNPVVIETIADLLKHQPVYYHYGQYPELLKIFRRAVQNPETQATLRRAGYRGLLEEL